MATSSILEFRRKRNAKQGLLNRKNGEAFEFKILREQKRTSLLAIRSAGSHSLIDLVAIKKNQQTWLISCKRNGYHTWQEREALAKLKESMPKNHVIKLVYYVGLKRYKYETL